MSRNIRQKYPAAAAKAQKRRRDSDTSSSLDLSDEEGYSAVEDISDSEDNDEEDVIAVEEEMILTEGLPKPPDAPRPLSDGDAEEEDAGDDEDEDDDEDDDAEEEAEDEDDGDADNASWAGIVSEVDDEHDFYQDPNAFASDPVVERHVRFDVPDSDSDSTETEDDHADLFPDIFVSQNALDPAFRKEIEHDPDESSGSNSFWDYHGHYEEEEGEDSDSDAEEVVRQLSDDDNVSVMPVVGPATAVENFTPTFEESLELDGYESDGDTTDEEDIPEPIIRKRSRRQSNALSDDEASGSEADSPVKPERGQPRVGRFNLDRSDKKPIAVLNPLTRKMMIFTPTRRRQLDLSPEQFNLPWAIEEHSTPLLSNSANMMLSAMFSSNTFGDFINAQAMGPAEAFFPFPAEANADDSSTAPSMEEEEEEDDEEKLNINDFITFGEADDDESSGDEASGNKWRASPNRPTTASSDMGEVLSHLNSNTVGAFRRNQINQQLILSNQATQDSLAFSGPYNYTALRGLKSDRFDTAAIPLTPARRHKKQLSDMARGPLDPLSAKRKATSEASGSNHKKHRSISSEVNALGL
ncbi:hypothetical protein V8C26DRAFT_110635 [Trichoderma gracile]